MKYELVDFQGYQRHDFSEKVGGTYLNYMVVAKEYADCGKTKEEAAELFMDKVKREKDDVYV